jgi:hypothetical protein
VFEWFAWAVREALRPSELVELVAVGAWSQIAALSGDGPAGSTVLGCRIDFADDDGLGFQFFTFFSKNFLFFTFYFLFFYFFFSDGVII